MQDLSALPELEITDYLEKTEKHVGYSVGSRIKDILEFFRYFVVLLLFFMIKLKNNIYQSSSKPVSHILYELLDRNAYN